MLGITVNNVDTYELHVYATPISMEMRPTYTFYVPLGGNPYQPDTFRAGKWGQDFGVGDDETGFDTYYIF